MNGRKELFIFPKAVKNLPQVDEWFCNEPDELFSIGRKWFTRLRQCGDDVTEIMHDGCPTACVNYAAFAYVNVFKAHVNLGFFTGAFLQDPYNLLQGSGKRMRHIKLKPSNDITSQALNELIDNAYRDVKTRLQR